MLFLTQLEKIIWNFYMKTTIYLLHEGKFPCNVLQIPPA